MIPTSPSHAVIAARRLILLACGLCYMAQGFEAWGWPAIDGYPFIERFVNPDYLSNDFYTNTFGGYNVDTMQAYLLGGLQRATGLRYDWSLAGLNFIRCLTFPALVYALFKALSDSREVALTGAVLGTLSVFALPKTLGWSWMWGDASTAMFAVPAIMLSWIALLRRRSGSAMIWAAVAAAIHPLTVVYGMIVMALVFVLDYSADERRSVFRDRSTLVCAALFGAVFVAQYLLLKSNASVPLPTAEFTEIIARERHPTDFLPSRFAKKSYLTFALTAAAVALILWRSWDAMPKRRLVVGVFATYAAICVAGYVFVELWPIRVVVDLMPFRTANIVAPFMLFVIAVFAERVLAQRRALLALAIAAMFVLASPYAARFIPAEATDLRLAAAAGLLLVVAVGLWIRQRAAFPVDEMVAGILGGRRLAVAAGITLVLIAANGVWDRRGAFVLPTAANQHPLYAWLTAQTPTNAVVLIDQFSADGGHLSAVNPQKVRLVGRRAVVASLDFPFLDRDMRPWVARWREVLGGTTPDRVDSADLQTLLTLRQTYPFDYVIRRTPLPLDPRISLDAVFGGTDSRKRVLVYHVTGG